MSKKDDADRAIELPSERVLKSLVRLSEQTRSKTGSLAGELGQAIKDAADRHNLHAGAFKQAAKLRRMDPMRLRAFLDHFDAYRDTLKLDDLAGADLFNDEEKPARKPKANGKGNGKVADETNVTHIRQPDTEAVA